MDKKDELILRALRHLMWKHTASETQSISYNDTAADVMFDIDKYLASLCPPSPVKKKRWWRF